MNQKDIHKLNTLYKTTILESKDSGPPYIEVDEYGTKYYYKDREMTILHREDGPAIEGADGYKAWYINGELHREDGPAVEDDDGIKEWYINGKLHREDGPAVEYANGRKEWWQNGERHREDGPAVEYADGSKAWLINGKKLTEKEFKAYLANKAYRVSFKDQEVPEFKEFD